MASFECGRQIKTEVQSVDDEVPCQKHDVKSEPSEAEMFSECGRKGDASDAVILTNDLEENDLKANMPIDKFDPGKIKIEENFFIPHLDLKSIKCENTIIEGSNLKACEEKLFSYENGFSNSWQNHNEAQAIALQNVTEDLKPVGLTADIGSVETKEEIFNENIPSAPDEMKFVVEDDYVVKHEMEPTTERINEQYNSEDCSNLKISQKMHSGENSFQSKMCSKSLAKAGSLKYHEKLHTGEKPFQCKICSKSFIRNNELIKHEKTHSGEKPFQCQICPKSFSRSDHLKYHEKIHTGEKSYECKTCSKSFTHQSGLIYHEKLHTGEKPYKCKVCSKSFIQGSSLKCHEKIHTGEKPFQCKTCSKSFNHQSAWIYHKKIHTGEKPFQCKICSKSFIRNSDLINHERTHSGEKPFQCKFCSKSFRQSHHLKNHVKIHTSDKKLQC